MTDTLLIILIVLMVITLGALCWSMIALAVVLRQQVPQIRQRVDDLHLRLAQVLEETIPTLRGTAKTLDEAQRTLHELAETAENLHYVSDNLRHKLEVADQIGAKVRRLPEKTARLLGRILHTSIQFGGQVLLRQIEKRRRPSRPTVYEVEPAHSPNQISAEPKAERSAGISPAQETDSSTSVSQSEPSAQAMSSTGVSPVQETHSSTGVSPVQETASQGEATDTTHNKEG